MSWYEPPEPSPEEELAWLLEQEQKQAFYDHQYCDHENHMCIHDPGSTDQVWL